MLHWIDTGSQHFCDKLRAEADSECRFPVLNAVFEQREFRGEKRKPALVVGTDGPSHDHDQVRVSRGIQRLGGRAQGFKTDARRFERFTERADVLKREVLNDDRFQWDASPDRIRLGYGCHSIITAIMVLFRLRLHFRKAGFPLTAG